MIMGKTNQHTRRSGVPRALSLVMVSQLLLGHLAVMPAAFAQESTGQQTEAPSWNDSQSTQDNLMLLESKKPELKPEIKPEVKPEIKAETEPEIKTEAKVETKTEIKAEEKTEVKAEKAEVKTEKTELKAEKSELKAEKSEEESKNNGKELASKTAPVEAATTTDVGVVNGATAPVLNEDAPLVVDTDSKADPAKADSVVTTTAASTTSTTTTETPAAGAITMPDGTLGIFKDDKTAEQEIPQVGATGPSGMAGALGTADTLDEETVHQLGATVNEIDTSKDEVLDTARAESETLVVDCDEHEQVERVVEYENLPTDEGKTKIKSGARFPVVVISQISSKTAKKGDFVEARLKYDLKIGDKMIAKKGAVVQGHINYCLQARSVLHSLVSPERWYRNSGCLGVEFDQIINDKNEHIPLVACPARTARVVNNKGEGRLLGVNHLGQVTGPWSQQLKYKAVRIGLNAALAPAGVFSFGAMPVALGVIGAANPSFAFMKPVGTNVRHRRIKGFAWGFLSGVPGSWLIEDTVTKGQEAIIKPGDEFLAEFKQEFNGEVASEAQLLPNAQAKVKGDVRSKGKKEK